MLELGIRTILYTMFRICKSSVYGIKVFKMAMLVRTCNYVLDLEALNKLFGGSVYLQISCQLFTVKQTKMFIIEL